MRKRTTPVSLILIGGGFNVFMLGIAAGMAEAGGYSAGTYFMLIGAAVIGTGVIISGA